MNDTVQIRSYMVLAVVVATLALSGCGAAPAPASGEPTPVRGAGSIHAVVHPENGPSHTLAVDYAAAGLGSLASDPDDLGSLVLVAVFRDGRVDDSLDLETLSISVPLSELPGQQGSLDVALDGSVLSVLLEGSSSGETRIVTPETVGGSLHLRYDAPPRPGITLRGDFSLLIPTGTSTLRLDGEFEVPVLGS